MNSDRTIQLATAAEQIAQREMQLDRLGVDLHGQQERINRLVRLLVEQKIQAGKVRTGKTARSAHNMPDINPRSEPAKHKEKRQAQQPPEFKFHE